MRLIKRSINKWKIWIEWIVVQLNNEWWAFVTVDIVLILKNLYDPIAEVVSIGPQLVKDGSAS